MSAPRAETSGHAPELPYQITYHQPNHAPFVVVACETYDHPNSHGVRGALAEVEDRAMRHAASVGGTWHRVGAGLGPSEFIVLSPAAQQVIGTFAIRRIIPAFRRQLPVVGKTTNTGRSV